MYSPLVRYLDTRLFARKLVHVFGGSLCAALVLWLPALWIYLLGGMVIALYLVISRRLSLALLGPLALLALTGSRLLVSATFTVLALGDGVASVVGHTLGHRRWPWRTGKTLEGSAANWLVASTGLFMLLSMLLPGTGPAIRLLLATIPALGGALAEALPLDIMQNGKSDDNLAVVLATGLAFYLLSACLGVAPPAGL
jgi:dolichol kinase